MWWLALWACTEPIPPNVLLITLDTTRFDALGAYGNPEGPTPNIDKLAAEGTRFDRAYTVTPLTIPAHSSLFTGLLPPRHGVQDNGDFFLDEGAFTLAEALKKRGYRTMASVGAEVTSHHWGFSQGFDAFYDDMNDPDQPNRWQVERPGSAVIADAQRWWTESPEDAGPWFAWVHLFDVHHPYVPPEPFASQLPDPYLGEVAYVDSLVGELVKGLEARGELENTWIIVMADHGEGLGAHGESTHGALLYDTTTHIPLIIRAPGRSPGVVASTVSSVDVFPTVLAAVGGEPVPGIDGQDLGPLLGGGAAEREVYVESLYAWRHYGWAPQRALVDNRFKWIGSTTPELYSIEDRAEVSNLAPTDAATAAAMSERLGAWKQRLTPEADISARAQESAERIAQLQALGYLTGEAPTEETENLPDPVEKLPVLRELQKIMQLNREGKTPEARQLLEEFVVREPGLNEPSLLLAQIRLASGDLDGAQALAEAVEAKTHSSGSKAALGHIARARGDMAGASLWYRGAVDADPYDAGAWVVRLTFLILSGQLELADTEVATAKANCPTSASITGLEGVILAARGFGDRALPLLEDALKRNSRAPLANYGTALVWKGRGNLEKAEGYFLEEVRQSPPAMGSRRALVEIYVEQRRTADQVAQVREILKVDPGDVLSHHSLAQGLFNLQDYPAAEKAIHTCLTVDPRYAPCVMLRANVLKKLGRDAEAQAEYQRALGLAKSKVP